MREPAGTVKSYAQNGLQAPGSMKSVGNEGVPKGCLQVIHVHVLLDAPLGAKPHSAAGYRPV